MLTNYADSDLTAEEFVDSITIREDGKLPLWHTQGSHWNTIGKVLGYRITEDSYVPKEYRNTLIRFLLTLEKDDNGDLTANKYKVSLLQKEIQEMYQKITLFKPNNQVEQLWKTIETDELGVYGWDSNMENHVRIRDKVVYTNSKKIQEKWSEGNFNCKQLNYYTTDEHEYLRLVIEQSNLNLNYKIIQGLPPQKISVIKMGKDTEHLKYHMNKWMYTCDWDWSENIEQRTRELSSAISKEE